MPVAHAESVATQSRQRTRLSPEQRRVQIIGVATQMLSADGVDALQISEVATRAGVTRPVVYRFFANRQALIVAVLEHFEAELEQRFLTDGLRSVSGGVEAAAGAFVAGVCDVIERLGAGPWHLLAAKGPDPEVARVGAAIQARLVAPWHAYIAEATGASPTEVEVVSHMLVAAGRAGLDLWLAGRVERDEAIAYAARGIGALLMAFTRGTGS